MAIQGCVKTVLDDSKYSSPVPVIGLYIAGASLVCFLAMLYDTVSGFRHRKRWLPCQWFSLGSVTLTMLGVAAKIPLDLTTPMPSALDQFSKLSGTTFLCIAMAFLLPSVGMKQTSECVNNMVALTIFAVTVFVNICLQIHTGVIFMFVIEHIIIMCCLLGFLSVLWLCILVATSEKESSIDGNKDLFTKGKGSMLERLKVAYVYAFNYNPQFVLCRNVEIHESTGLCIICLVVLLRASTKSLSWEFCRGSSDYVWSMWFIVMIQILTIILGSVANISRCFAFPSRARLDLLTTSVCERPIFVIFSIPALRLEARDRSRMCLFIILLFPLMISHLFVMYPLMSVRFLLQKMFGLCFKHNAKEPSDIDEYRCLIHGRDRGLQEWVVVKAAKDIQKCVNANRSESSSYHLSPSLPKILLLSSDQSCNVKLKKDRLSSLSMVLLVRIAEVSLPSKLSDSLVKVYDEASDIIHFVEDRILSRSFGNRKESELAKAVWRGKDFSSILRRLPDSSSNHVETSPTHLELHRALVIIQKLKTALPSDIVWDEVGRIIDILTDHFDHSSLENLYGLMEGFFLDMLHELLVQLPHAIYKEVTESSAEDIDKRVRLCLGILCRVESLEAHVQWSFPVGCGMPYLITARDAVADARSASHLGGDVINNVSGDVVVEISE